jgi:dihydroxyacetone kinase-like protein
MFEAGLEKLSSISKAQVGDKTMMDALVPAVAACSEMAASGASCAAALDQASKAAEQGAESTRDLQAQFGKARNLGQRSVGHKDPGAASLAMLLRGFAEGAAATTK